MPAIDTKSREEAIKQMGAGENDTQKARYVVNFQIFDKFNFSNRRLFSGLVVGTLNRFRKEKLLHEDEQVCELSLFYRQTLFTCSNKSKLKSKRKLTRRKCTAKRNFWTKNDDLSINVPNRRWSSKHCSVNMHSFKLYVFVHVFIV